MPINLLAVWSTDRIEDPLGNLPKKSTHAQPIEQQLPECIVAKEQDCQERHGEYNHHRRSVKLSFGRPRNLAHLGFDRDQKVRKPRPMDQAKSKPHACRDQGQRQPVDRCAPKRRTRDGRRRGDPSVHRLRQLPTTQPTCQPNRQCGELANDAALLGLVLRTRQ